VSDKLDFVIVGSGIAGLQTALLAAEHGRVMVLTKSGLMETNTNYAQGGIAVASGVDDDPDLHFQDTIAAGAGLCDEEVVRVLVDEGLAAVRRLVETGVRFDEAEGEFLRGMEGAHSVARVLHAAGAETGAEIQSALTRAAREAEVELVEQALVVDLIMEGGRCRGVLALLEGEAALHEIRAERVVLTTGGAGMLYKRTTNPVIATADGVAAAIRAGAVVSGLEFIQFHPTVLDIPGAPPFLLSEALRGAGAKIVDRFGHRFLLTADDRGELAPRDIVSRSILWRLEESGPGSVFLDATELDEGIASKRYPGLARSLRSHGLDLDRDRVPVAPAAHYLIGGIATDVWGRTSTPGLYACGEVASSGVHGANRLASNSLLEAVVFASRVVKLAVGPATAWPDPVPASTLAPPQNVDTGRLTRDEIGELMWEDVGMLRDSDRLKEAATRLGEGLGTLDGLNRGAVEDANLNLVALFAAHAALGRPESRGTHYRMDFPKLDPELARPTFYRITEPAPLAVDES
jgi:L-aspartate oxidase